MKKDWTYKKLGEVCDFEGGSQPPKSEWINSPKEGYVRMLQIRDFTKSREAEIEYVKLSKKLRLCKSDDILIGRYGASVGKILTGLEGAYNVAIIKSIPDESQILKRYIRRYFESCSFQQLLQKVCVVRTAQAGFAKDDIKDTLIPLPPLSEQSRIVSRLDAAFGEIEGLKAKAEAQLREARTLFQAALTQEMKPKQGWEEKKLGDVGEVIGGTTPSTSNPAFWNGDLCWISPAELHGEHYLYDSVKKITAEAVKSKSLKVLPIGTVILSSRAPIGKLAINKVPMYCNQGFKCVVCGEKLYNEYLYWWLYGKTDYLNSLGTGATFPEISKSVVENISIPLPPLSAQQSIVSRLDALSEKVRELEEAQKKVIAECDALKQALLREVFE